MLFSLLDLLRCFDQRTVMVLEERCQPAMIGWLKVIVLLLMDIIKEKRHDCQSPKMVEWLGIDERFRGSASEIKSEPSGSEDYASSSWGKVAINCVVTSCSASRIASRFTRPR